MCNAFQMQLYNRTHQLGKWLYRIHVRIHILYRFIIRIYIHCIYIYVSLYACRFISLSVHTILTKGQQSVSPRSCQLFCRSELGVPAFVWSCHLIKEFQEIPIIQLGKHSHLEWAVCDFDTYLLYIHLWGNTIPFWDPLIIFGSHGASRDHVASGDRVLRVKLLEPRFGCST